MALQTHPSVYEGIMPTKQIETNDVNGNLVCHHANPVISNRRKWSSQENKIVMECYLLSEPKVRGNRKHMLSLWLNKGMFWVSEQRLVDQANTLRRNIWMADLEIEELERNLAENDSYIEVLMKERSEEVLMIQVVT